LHFLPLRLKESISEEFQMEVLDLNRDKQKQKYTNVGVPDFYKFL